MTNSFFAGAFILGSLLLNSFFEQPKLSESVKRGKEIYARECGKCHMEDGKGTPEYPPLTKSDYLKKPAKDLIKIVLEGQTGEVKVNGKKYDAVMPPQNYLNDEEVADVLNYVRSSWGNKATGSVTPEQVKAAR